MARLQQKKQAAGTTGSAQDIPTFPARWFCSLYALFPGTGFVAPVASELVIRPLGISTGMPEPRDFTVASDRSSARETRAAIRSAHRIPHPTFVTIAKRPSLGRDARIKPRFRKNGNRNILARGAGQGDSR